MFTAEYWNNRAVKYGHTGHSESFYYCYGQQARLYAINEIIKKLQSPKNNALDFGCGSGDFINVLNNHYKTIYAFDISDEVIKKVKQQYNQKNIIILDELTSSITFDLILTVTVLQTLNKTELEKQLSFFSKLLSEKGVMVSMEFFTTDDYNIKLNETKATIKDWNDALENNHLKITSTTGINNAILNPIKSWKSYNNNLLLKLLKPFKNNSFAQRQFIKVSEKLIYKYKDVLNTNDYPFKIHIIEKEK